MAAQAGMQRQREQGLAVAVALALADGDRRTREVDILDAEVQALEQAQAGAVEQARHEVGEPWQVAQQGGDLRAIQNGGQPGRALRSDEAVEPGQDHAEHFLVEEEQGRQGLVLRRGGNLALVGEVVEEPLDVGGAKLAWMPA